MEERKTGLSRFGKILILLVLLCVLAFFLAAAGVAGLVGRVSDSGEKKPHLILLRLDGPIFASEPTLEILSRIEKDENCKGVLLRVESPGGAVGSSQEIYGALKRLRVEKRLPLVVSFGNVAASGGYYAALAGERIFSNPGTLTGSIGVIFQFPEAEKLMEKAGVSLQTVKSGALKDVGSPARKPTPGELAYLQGVIDDTYAQFLADVAENRHLNIDSLRPLADGRVFTGRQALAKGLVDTLGGLDDAKRYLAAKVQSPEIAWITEPKPKSRLEEFLDPESRSPLGSFLSGVRQRMTPGAFFLWP